MRTETVRILRTVSTLWCALSVAGCNWNGSLGGPERVVPVTSDVETAKTYLASVENRVREKGRLDKYERNSYVTARMYVIDMQYTEYEAALLREGQLMDFGTKLTSGVLTTVSGLMSSLSTAHTLAESATLVNGIDSAYNDKVLKSQLVNSLMSSMRTARHDQAAAIYANMYCSVSVYPMGMALSDLEAYYRAGTFQTGLIKLAQTVGKAETDSKANQDQEKPATTPQAQATIESRGTEAKVKSDSAKAKQRIRACRSPTGGDYYEPRHSSANQPGSDVTDPRAFASQPRPQKQM